MLRRFKLGLITLLTPLALSFFTVKAYSIDFEAELEQQQALAQTLAASLKSEGVGDQNLTSHLKRDKLSVTLIQHEQKVTQQHYDSKP